MNRLLVACSAGFLLCGGAVLAESPGITIEDARAQAAPENAMSVDVYLTIRDSAGSDRLQAATTPVAAGVAIHRTVNQLGVMRMGDVHGVDIDEDKPFVFKPGGYSLVLTDLAQPLKPGDTFPLTLMFAHAGAVEATVTVAPGAG